VHCKKQIFEYEQLHLNVVSISKEYNISYLICATGPICGIDPARRLVLTFYLYVLVEVGGSPLWSSGQSSWLQIQRSGFNSRHYQIFWEVVGLVWGPLSFVSIVEELRVLERNSSGSGLESRDYGRRDPSRWPCGTLYPQKRHQL
jgi:hypothetical protein